MKFPFIRMSRDRDPTPPFGRSGTNGAAVVDRLTKLEKEFEQMYLNFENLAREVKETTAKLKDLEASHTADQGKIAALEAELGAAQVAYQTQIDALTAELDAAQNPDAGASAGGITA